MCAKLNELQIGEVVLNVELDRRQMLVKPQHAQSKPREESHKSTLNGRKVRKNGNDKRESIVKENSEPSNKSLPTKQDPVPSNAQREVSLKRENSLTDWSLDWPSS
jgi:hypothetical protein